jgi:hypothetical protein
MMHISYTGGHQNTTGILDNQYLCGLGILLARSVQYVMSLEETKFFDDFPSSTCLSTEKWLSG